MRIVRRGRLHVGVGATIAVLGAAGAVAISSDVASSNGTTAPKPATASSKPFLLETTMVLSETAPPRTTVKRMFIGERALCKGARAEDSFKEGPHGPTITKRIRCGTRGTLDIRFSPRPFGGAELNQSSSWKLVRATGSFRKLEGRGWMFVRFARDKPRANETFTGTLR